MFHKFVWGIILPENQPKSEENDEEILVIKDAYHYQSEDYKHRQIEFSPAISKPYLLVSKIHFVKLISGEEILLVEFRIYLSQED